MCCEDVGVVFVRVEKFWVFLDVIFFLEKGFYGVSIKRIFYVFVKGC